MLVRYLAIAMLFVWIVECQSRMERDLQIGPGYIYFVTYVFTLCVRMPVRTFFCGFLYLPEFLMCFSLGCKIFTKKLRQKFGSQLYSTKNSFQFSFSSTEYFNLQMSQSCHASICYLWTWPIVRLPECTWVGSHRRKLSQGQRSSALADRTESF